jgi:nitrate/TMAO reductase-like tetraheme cytochrome c subunit
MIRNMGVLDRILRVFVIAPAAIVVALLLGAGTVGGIVLFVVAGIMLASSTTAFCPT